MSIDDIEEETGLNKLDVQLALHQLLNARLIYYKQHVGYCRYAIAPARVTFNVPSISLVFAVVPCR